jgi:hypothetical protein
MRQPFGSKLAAGDTWTWSITGVSQYDLSVYTIKYSLRGLGGTLDLTQQADGAGGYQLQALPTDTTKLSAGVYAWALYATKGMERHEIGRGTVEVLPDLQAAGGDAGVDGRSFAKRMLDAIRAVLEGRASRIESEYQQGGRALKLLSPQQLIDAEAYWARRYKKELIDSGQLSRNSNQVRVRFS